MRPPVFSAMRRSRAATLGAPPRFDASAGLARQKIAEIVAGSKSGRLAHACGQGIRVFSDSSLHKSSV
jgi:hypothetical protein